MTFWQSSSPALHRMNQALLLLCGIVMIKTFSCPNTFIKTSSGIFFLCPMYAKNIIQFFHLKHKCNLNKEKIEISNNENFFQITSMSMSNVPKSWICFEKMTLAALLDQSSNFTLFQKKNVKFFFTNQTLFYHKIFYNIIFFFI